MGVTLERTRIADTLLESLSSVMGSMRGGLGIAVTLVGMLMAASTGIVGATVVTMGLLALPTMLRHGYDARLATGTICATGTLGQIIPPSIALVLLGDVLSGAYQQAQLTQGVFSPKTVSVGDLFAGALLLGLVLVALYVGYIATTAFVRPKRAPRVTRERPDGSSLWTLLRGLAPPLVLIVAVLGSILGGFATPTEAAGVGALGALLLAAAYRSLGLPVVKDICVATLKTTAMVFFILIGVWGATVIVMVAIFLLGFILDFIEITYVVVPIVAPILLAMGLDPVWLGVLIAVNLQTSFLTPPFGFALFYLRGVAPSDVATLDIYQGAVPFIALQVLMMFILVALPELATWLPGVLY